jgi:hypothetical protein
MATSSKVYTASSGCAGGKPSRPADVDDERFVHAGLVGHLRSGEARSGAQREVSAQGVELADRRGVGHLLVGDAALVEPLQQAQTIRSPVGARVVQPRGDPCRSVLVDGLIHVVTVTRAHERSRQPDASGRTSRHSGFWAKFRPDPTGSSPRTGGGQRGWRDRERCVRGQAGAWVA